jgi:hypothetical protein
LWKGCVLFCDCILATVAQFLRHEKDNEEELLLETGKQDMNILMNMHRPPTEGNFCDRQGTTKKPVTVTDYNQHKGYVGKGRE